MRLLFLILLLVPALAYPGQGRDGGWPQSIQLLRIAKSNLLDLLANSSDIDVKDALNNMSDREEAIKLKDVNLELLKELVNKLEDPDVEQIEKSNYTGVRLFSYEGDRTFATRKFFEMQRYQVPVNEISPALIKEVQTLILHEVSHLWGYGEENGDINYARTFAARMVNILHGSLKINFTDIEKLESLTKAFYYEGTDIKKVNLIQFLEKETFTCLSISSDQVITKTFNQIMAIDDKSISWISNGYLLVEIYGAGDGEIYSSYLDSKGIKTQVQNFVVCHSKVDMLNDYLDLLVRPYYTKSNLLSSYAHSSPVIFQSLLIQDLNYIGNNVEEAITASISNQEKIIHNYDFKIKVQNADAYNRLISRKYKESKPKDSKDIDLFNSLINSDFSTQGNSSWALITVKMSQLYNEIRSMQATPSRQLQMESFLNDFFKEFNRITKKSHELEETDKQTSFRCFNEKRIGDYYACNMEASKISALDKMEKYKSLNTEMKALIKRFSLKALQLND